LARGQEPLWLGLWWVHAIFALLAATLFNRRARGKTLLPRFALR
jgi:lipopolysaccharide export LptBFGC system permease protein LptF